MTVVMSTFFHKCPFLFILWIRIKTKRISSPLFPFTHLQTNDGGMARKSQWRLIAESVKAKRLQKRTFTLKIGENSVGRLKKCDIPIPSKLCSRHHCDIHVDGEIITLRDHVRHNKIWQRWNAFALNSVFHGPLRFIYFSFSLNISHKLEHSSMKR